MNLITFWIESNVKNQFQISIRHMGFESHISLYLNNKWLWWKFLTVNDSNHKSSWSNFTQNDLNYVVTWFKLYALWNLICSFHFICSSHSFIFLIHKLHFTIKIHSLHFHSYSHVTKIQNLSKPQQDSSSKSNYSPSNLILENVSKLIKSFIRFKVIFDI